jgi:hypothetical protein
MPTGPESSVKTMSALARSIAASSAVTSVAIADGCHVHLHLRQRRLQALDDRLGPHRLLGDDRHLRRVGLGRGAHLLADVAEHRQQRAEQVRRLGRGDAEPVLVAVVVLLDVLAELGVGRAGAEEDLLVVHRHFLHREHRLGAEAADQEVGLVARDRALDGIGGIGHRLDLVGVGAHQLDLALLAADADAARLVDLVARHLRAGPVVLALHEVHRPENGDLDALRERERRGQCDGDGQQSGA